MQKKFAIVVWIVAAFLMVLGTGKGFAEDDYPSKTIVLTVHTAPGGGMDIMGRNLIEALKAEHINAVIENRPGGSGYMNLAYLASRPGDGYTLSTAGRAHLIARHIANMPLEFRDFKAVARIATEEYAVVSKAGGRWNTIQEVIADMKVHPGEIKLGGGFVGTPDSLLAFGIFKALGQKPAFVPYEDAAQITVGLLGDQLQLAVVNPAESQAQIAAGQFKVLAVASEQRSPFFPDVPTLREAGLDVIGVQWRGIWAPKETPDDIVDKAAAMIKSAIKEKVFQDYLKSGMLVEAYLGPAEFQQAMEQDDRELSQMADELGLRGSQANK
jgi:tripartite-type tricarboxylate transporter receptor subunit TctC